MTDRVQSPPANQDYVVVARRYRPQGFDELIGQQHVAQALKRAISSDRVGHAYLFTGARGVGKTSAARILAKALNCEQGPTANPCNECEICHSIAAGDDVDVLEIDGASNRGIDEIRQLRQNVAIRPSRARLKIYIIDEVHMLTKEAFNALLKTLEEPPEHVKFIFATTEAIKIPITILSRCQRFDFAGIETKAIQERLAQIAESEGVAAEPEALQILAMRAAGSMRDSQSLLEQLLSGGGQTITAAAVTEMLGIAPAARLSQLVLPMVNHDAATALGELDSALAEGAEVSQLMDQLLGYFRDVLTQTVGCDESRLLYTLPAQLEEVREVAQKLGVHTLLAMIQVLDQAAARMKISTHARTLAEMAIVRVCQLDNLDELAMLLEQLRDQPHGSAESSQVIKKNGPVKESLGKIPLPPRTPPTRNPSAANHESQIQVAVEESPPPAALPLTSENVEQIWKQALHTLNGMIADHASYVDEVAVDDLGRLVITFSEVFYRDSCERPTNRGRLESALREVCGRKVPLILQATQRATESEKPQSSPPSRRQQQMELISQPFVKKAIELFDGDTQRIKYIPPTS